MSKGYDTHCFDLAKHFLAGNTRPGEAEDLAQWIQDHIELWFIGRAPSNVIEMRAADVAAVKETAK